MTRMVWAIATAALLLPVLPKRRCSRRSGHRVGCWCGRRPRLPRRVRHRVGRCRGGWCLSCVFRLTRSCRGTVRPRRRGGRRSGSASCPETRRVRSDRRRTRTHIDRTKRSAETDYERSTPSDGLRLNALAPELGNARTVWYKVDVKTNTAKPRSSEPAADVLGLLRALES